VIASAGQVRDNRPFLVDTRFDCHTESGPTRDGGIKCIVIDPTGDQAGRLIHNIATLKRFAPAAICMGGFFMSTQEINGTRYP
jgi:hypothetical protein